jgi:tape measure domain-containing protein
VPLTGAIQELGGEFGNAVKQVLLFGTAYKALAFIIDLPNQALAAATSLQTFNNQLLAVTGSTGAANQAFGFVDSLAERFNVPLESARQGFVRLYASMEPAGFAPDQIEGLFTGISKAAATFGLSADQVDRVTYAFSQMASKGQAMSEELKGQLGDVLPGSLALFARAAQMSIPEFTEALEDGAFKGEAFQALLRNVAKLMNTEFAGGAAGAADTLQGRMNDLSNSVTKMYESFEPLVGLISAQVFPQLSEIIGDATEAVQAFVGGIQGAEDPAAQLSSRGLAIYEALRQVADIGQSLQGIISALAPTFGALGQMILGTVQAVAQLLNTKAGQWLAKFALQVAAATAALQLMARVGLFNAVAGLIRFVTNIRGSIAALKVMITTTRIAKIALGGLFAAGIMIGLEALAGKLTNVGSAARDAAAETRRLSDELDAAISAGNVEIPRMEYQAAENQAQSLKKAIGVLEKIGPRGGGQISEEEYNVLQRTGLASGITRGPTGATSALRGQVDQSLKAARAGYVSALNAAGKAKEAWDAATQVYQNNQRQQVGLEAIDLSGGTETGARKAGKELSDYDRDLQQFYDNQLKIRTAAIEADMSLLRREKELLIAREKFRADELKAEAQHTRDLSKLESIKPAQRQQAKLDLEIKKEQRLQIAQADYGKVVLEPIIKAAEDEAEAKEKLREQIKLLTEGREELTAVEKVNISITKALQGLDKDVIAQIQDRVDKLRKEAAATDTLRQQVTKLTEAQKLRKQAEETKTSLQNRLSMARAFTPGQEIRERFRQEGFTPAQIEEYARMEEAALMLEDLKGAANGVREAFAEVFSEMITGSASAQESLGRAFSSIGKSFADMAAKLVTQWLFIKAVGLVGSLFGGGAAPALRSSGGATMTAGQATQAGFGMGASLAKGFATGGVVTGPTLGLIGEGRFNEAVVPLPNGKSIPVDLGKNAAGNVSTNIVVNVNNGQTSSRVSGGQGNQLAKNLEGAVKEVIMRETRPGGIIYSSR